MQGTYWLTVLPETSQLRPRIKRALRGIDDDVRVHPTVDDRKAEPSGRAFGDKFRRGFERSGASKIGAAARLVGVGFKFASDQAGNVVRHVGAAAAAIGIAARLAKGFSASLLAASVGLKYVAGISLAKLGAALGFTAKLAGRLATQVSRVTAAILVLAAVGKVLSFMNRFAKLAAVATIGSAALIGVVSALATTLGSALVSALTVAGAAIGVFAGAALGLLGPAIGTLKLAFKGLGEGAKAFTESMKDVWGPADEAFNKMIGQRMAPLLTQFRELKMLVVDTFSNALTPAFGSLTNLMAGLQPRFAALSTTLGRLGSEVAGALASPANAAALDKMFAASDRFFQNFLGESGISGVVGGLVQFAATAADTFASTGRGINDQLLRFGEWLRGISPQQMLAAFAGLRQMVSSVWSVLKPVIVGIRDIGAVSAPALAPGIKAIGAAIGQATPLLVKMSQILMPALSAVMERLAPVIPDLVRAFTPWAGVLATIAPPLATVVANLAPLAPLLLVAVGAVKALAVGTALYNTAMLVAANATKVWTAAQWLFNAAMTANPIGIVIAAVVAAGVALWAFFTKTETGRKLWDKIWTGIKAAAKVVADWFMTTAVPALKSAWDAIAAGAMWLWNEAIVPAFEGIRAAIGVAWSVIGPIWELFKAGIELVGSVIGWLWNTVAVPAFSAIGSAISTFWDGAKAIWGYLTDAFDKVAAGVGVLKDAFTTGFNAVKTVVTTVWDTISGIFDKISNGVGNVVDKLRGIPGLGALLPGGHADGKPAGFAGGRPAVLSRSGRLSGPGTGTSDSILAMLSNDEGVVKASAMNAGGGVGAVLVAALNSGWVPSAEFLHGMLPGFAEGLNPGADFLRTTIMQQWPSITSIGGQRSEDGYGEHSSGNAIDVMIPNYSTPAGKQLGDQIASFIAKNKDVLGADGMIWRQTSFGYGGDWTSGKTMDDRGSDTQNHMDHLHIMLGKGRGAGAPAVQAASASSLTLPGGGAGGGSATLLGSATSAGSGSYRAATDRELTASAGRVDSANEAVRQAEQSVSDRQYSVEKAQRRLDEAKAKGKGVADAEHSLEAANRELDDANRRLAKARDKATDVEQKDTQLRTQGVEDAKAAQKSSGGGFDDLGKSLWGGLLETIGLDGSVFSNPFEWPTVKSIMAGVNVLGSALMGGEPGSAAGPGGGFDLGSVLGGVADSSALDLSANLNPATADVAAAPATNVAPDTTQHGTGAGQNPGPAVVIENAGMSPTDVANTVSAEMNARTRTTKVH